MQSCLCAACRSFTHDLQTHQTAAKVLATAVRQQLQLSERQPALRWLCRLRLCALMHAHALLCTTWRPTWNRLLMMLTQRSSTSRTTSLSPASPLLFLILLRPMKMANSCASAPASTRRSHAAGDLQQGEAQKGGLDARHSQLCKSSALSLA